MCGARPRSEAERSTSSPEVSRGHHPWLIIHKVRNRHDPEAKALIAVAQHGAIGIPEGNLAKGFFPKIVPRGTTKELTH
jgi:hypothetical protein